MENLWKVVIILLVLWLVGVITAHTFGGAVYGLLIAAIVIALIRIFQGKKPIT
jgi:multisubunit Na+/H+ antiporter MnhE subunit